MSVCGACIYKLHHFSRKRKTGGGEDCECKCVGEPARALSKQEKLRRLQIALETPTPSDHSVLSELSTRVIGLQRQVTSIRKEMLLHNPTPHQCTISPEFAFILINRMDELEKRVGQLAQEPTKAQVDPAVQEVPSQSPDKIIPLKLVERAAILSALEQCEFHAGLAIKALKVSSATFYRRAHFWGFKVGEMRSRFLRDRRARFQAEAKRERELDRLLKKKLAAQVGPEKPPAVG